MVYLYLSIATQIGKLYIYISANVLLHKIRTKHIEKKYFDLLHSISKEFLEFPKYFEFVFEQKTKKKTNKKKTNNFQQNS